MVASIAPGSGRPSSMKSEPPLASTRLGKLLLPPNVWLHGSSVDQHRRRLGDVARMDAAHLIAWFAVIIRWVLMTPLGVPVEPEVNRSFAIVSGPTFARARSTSAVGIVATSASSDDERRDVEEEVCFRHDLDVLGDDRFDRPGERSPVADEHTARRRAAR